MHRAVRRTTYNLKLTTLNLELFQEPFGKKKMRLGLPEAHSLNLWSFGATVSFLMERLSVESVSSPRKAFISFPTIAHHFTLSYGDYIWGKVLIDAIVEKHRCTRVSKTKGKSSNESHSSPRTKTYVYLVPRRSVQVLR